MIWRPTLEDVTLTASEVLGIDPARAAEAVDPTLAESALTAPFAGFGTLDRIPSVEEKAAVLVERLARNRPVAHDGSDATAFVLGVLFVERNGLRWRAEEGEQDATTVAALASGQITHRDAVAWIRERTR